MPAPRAGGRGIRLRGRRVQPGAVKRKYRPRKSKQLAVPLRLRKQIESVMNKNDETKYVAETIIEEQNFNSGIGSTNPLVPFEMYRALPTLYQAGGSLGASFTRIGKQVQPISAKVDFRFNFDHHDNNAREIRVVLYMLVCKSETVYTNALPAQPISTLFLDDGNGNNVRFQGTYLQSKYPIDKDNWRILHKRTFSLSKGMGLLNDNTLSSSQGKYREKSITLNVPVPKLLKYDEQVIWPAHYAPVWAVGYYYADDTAPDLDLSSGCLHVSARAHMWFKDS